MMKKITGFVLACILFVLSCVNYAEASKNVCEHLVEDRIIIARFFLIIAAIMDRGNILRYGLWISLAQTVVKDFLE